MAYDLNQFVADCRTSLNRDPGPGGREEVRRNLERLLGNPDFVAKYCGDDAPKGLHLLYEDKDLGFQVLAHINAKGRSRRRTITARPGRSTAKPTNTPT